MMMYLISVHIWYDICIFNWEKALIFLYLGKTTYLSVLYSHIDWTCKCYFLYFSESRVRSFFHGGFFQITYLPKQSIGTGKELHDLPFGMIKKMLSLGIQEISCLKSDILRKFQLYVVKKKKLTKPHIFVRWVRSQSIWEQKLMFFCLCDFYTVNYNNFSTIWMA